MPSRLTRGSVRAAVAMGACTAVLWAVTPVASAGDGSPPPSSSSTPTSANGRLSSRVTVTGPGKSGGSGTQPITSSDVNFSPPDCWYESFTPDEFKGVLDQRYTDAGNNHAGTIYDYYYGVRNNMEDIHYHKGDDGSWWLLVYNPDLPADTGGNCTLTEGWRWVGPGDPPVPGVVTAKMLSDVAYKETQLPVGKIQLSPSAQNQKVNLATYVKFAAALPETWVTAQVPNPPVAATVVADPYSLHVEAGTGFADPRSCDYRFVPSGDAYNVDTSGSGCNLTYRKATPHGGSYTLTVQITWHVHWTASADRNGPVAQTLADGYTTTTQNVTVQEIQAVNR